MFTGIVETTGNITSAEIDGSNRIFWIESAISNQLKIDQSVSHSGICLTVDALAENRHRVTAIAETLRKTNAGSWQPDMLINLERCMQLNDRLDGHLVQGHTDAAATCISVTSENGSWVYRFSFNEKFAALMIEKGSVCLNGISLTVFNVTKSQFSVAIIPYTYHHTNIREIKTGDTVNIEFDMVGKYIQRMASLKTAL